jgi:hypothetical protein
MTGRSMGLRRGQEGARVGESAGICQRRRRARHPGRQSLEAGLDAVRVGRVSLDWKACGCWGGTDRGGRVQREPGRTTIVRFLQVGLGPSRMIHATYATIPPQHFAWSFYVMSSYIDVDASGLWPSRHGRTARVRRKDGGPPSRQVQQQAELSLTLNRIHCETIRSSRKVPVRVY